MVWRGKQYVRGIRLFYQRMHRFPVELDDLTKPKTGLRFMRQAYKDPMNQVDGTWRLIYLGPGGVLIGSLKMRCISFTSQPGLAGAAPVGPRLVPRRALAVRRLALRNPLLSVVLPSRLRAIRPPAHLAPRRAGRPDAHSLRIQPETLTPPIRAPATKWVPRTISPRQTCHSLLWVEASSAWEVRSTRSPSSGTKKRKTTACLNLFGTPQRMSSLVAKWE